MKKYEEISENRIFTNNEIKKMQEENHIFPIYPRKNNIFPDEAGEFH